MRLSAAARALVALLAGLALGIAAARFGGAGAVRAAGWLEPVGTMWVNAIRMTVIPLIVASLVVSVSAAGPRTVGRLGTRAIVLFFALLIAVALFGVLVAAPVFNTLSIDASAAASIRAGSAAVQRPELPTFTSWLVGLVPANPVKAAADGAMLPLVIFTIAFALALSHVEDPGRERVTGFFRGVAEAMTMLVRGVLVLAPIGVFALALPLAAKMGTGVVGAVGFYLVVHSALLAASLPIFYITVALFSTVPVGQFARAALPAQIVGASTRSSMAALPAMFIAAERDLRVPPAVSSFVLPFAVSTFRVNSSMSWLVMAIFAAKLYGVHLGVPEMASIVVASVLMSFSVPGIPSGGLFIIAPFFESVGIPAEAVGVLIALDLIPDVFKTTANMTGHLTAVAMLRRFDA